jgi:hypothetical protein
MKRAFDLGSYLLAIAPDRVAGSVALDRVAPILPAPMPKRTPDKRAGRRVARRSRGR